MKNTWIIANWKSNKTIKEALDWISEVGPKVPKTEQLKIVVCPVFSVLSEVKKAITVGNFPLLVGAQNLSPFGVGAYTGEEPAQLIKELVSLAILGHSERRQNFAEDDQLIAQKVAQATENNIIPIVCVQGAETVVPDGCQLAAYEPVFAIGTGQPDTPENANEVAKSLQVKYPDLQVLYGGSVSADNISAFTVQPNLSGVLIGKASLNALDFIKICQIAAENVNG